MNNSWRDKAMALAGLLQAVSLVEDIAKTGYLKTSELETAVNSLFQTQPASVTDVFGRISSIHTGLEDLEALLSDYRKAGSSDIFRYALGAMHIQKRLSKRQDTLAVIAARLDAASRQALHFGTTHDNVIRNIADIYSDTISTFQYRIQVTGNYNYLQQDRVANQVRTLLLAAIRASMLWRQLGGSRWHFLLKRQELINASQLLIKQAKEEHLSGAA